MIVTILSKSEFISKYDSLKLEDDVFFISILEPKTEIIDIDSDIFITEYFWDVENIIGNYRPMTNKQADRLADHILKNKDKSKLYVHCHAGVSRSGAVGEVVNDFFGIAYGYFKRNNPKIVPNLLVKRLLKNKLEKKIKKV